MGSNEAAPGTVVEGAAPLSLEAWRFVRQMLDDMTATVEADAETELELLEGLRVLGRVTALCSELSLDVDADEALVLQHEHRRRGFVGGPNPDGEYFLGDDRRPPPLPRPRPRGARAPTSASRCWPAPASPRGAWPPHVSDRELDVGRRRHVRPRARRPRSRPAEELAGAPVGADPRRRLGDRGARVRGRPRRRGAGRARPSSRSTRRALPPLPDRRRRSPSSSRAWRGPSPSSRRCTRPIQARAARPAQRAGRPPRRPTSARPTPRPTTSTCSAPSGSRPDEALRASSSSRPTTRYWTRHAREHLARVHRPPPAAQLDHQRRRGGRRRRHRARSSIAADRSRRGELARHRRPPPGLRDSCAGSTNRGAAGPHPGRADRRVVGLAGGR